MRSLFPIFVLLVFSFRSEAITFSEAIKKLEKHESFDTVMSKSRALSEEAELKGSWGDPKIKMAAKNFPKNNLKDDQTSMTGVEFGVSQKIALI